MSSNHPEPNGGAIHDYSSVKSKTTTNGHHLNQVKAVSVSDQDNTYQHLNGGLNDDGSAKDHDEDYGVSAVLYEEEEYNTLVHDPRNSKRSSSQNDGQDGHDSHQTYQHLSHVSGGPQDDGNTEDHGEDYGATAVLYDEEEYNALAHGSTNGRMSSNLNDAQDGGDSYQTLGLTDALDSKPTDSVDDNVYNVLNGSMDGATSGISGPIRNGGVAVQRAGNPVKSKAGQNRISETSHSPDDASEYHVYEASALDNRTELSPRG